MELGFEEGRGELGRATNVFTNHKFMRWRLYAVNLPNPYSHLKPLARLVDYSVAGVDPTIMGIGPAYAIQSLLLKNNVSLGDFELVEVISCNLVTCNLVTCNLVTCNLVTCNLVTCNLVRYRCRMFIVTQQPRNKKL